MARTNPKVERRPVDIDARVAGGFGVGAAWQSPERLLRRAVLANLLWEDNFYEDGVSIADHIRELVPQVSPDDVATIAAQARSEQKLRHVPLLLARECARHKTHRHVVADLLAYIVQRPDELSEFVALYWQDGREPLANSVRKGLARAFTKFDAYQLAKYNGGDRQIKLRDVMFLVHPEPKDQAQAVIFKQLADNELPTPDTWEVALSTGQDKRETWERLIGDRKLGALAFLRNLRNMNEAGVSSSVIREGFKNLNVERLLPLNFFAAAQHAPQWQDQIEQAMFRSLDSFPKLTGHTHLIVDVSGSMGAHISSKSQFNRLDAAAAMAVLGREMCESVTIWATAGSDYARRHETKRLKPHRGFALAEQINRVAHELGGGGIFTRQCLEYIAAQTDEPGDRTIIFSDSQDCDYPHLAVPAPFSTHNYIVDVSAHTRGIAYNGVWTAEISGWSEQFLPYIQAYESASLQ